jgi:hypothetical protein
MILYYENSKFSSLLSVFLTFCARKKEGRNGRVVNTQYGGSKNTEYQNTSTATSSVHVAGRWATVALHPFVFLVYTFGREPKNDKH